MATVWEHYCEMLQIDIDVLVDKCDRDDRTNFQKKMKRQDIFVEKQRELCHVPLSIATTDGNLRPANKSQLFPILKSGDVTQTRDCQSHRLQHALS